MDLKPIRAAFAEELRYVAHVRSDRVVIAFATVPRESFPAPRLGRPWTSTMGPAGTCPATTAARPNVEVITADGWVTDPGMVDVIVLNAGATHPIPSWLGALMPGEVCCCR
jgi:protein-L-isoaspartate O-methyltransferase